MTIHIACTGARVSQAMEAISSHNNRRSGSANCATHPTVLSANTRYIMNMSMPATPVARICQLRWSYLRAAPSHRYPSGSGPTTESWHTPRRRTMHDCWTIVL